MKETPSRARRRKYEASINQYSGDKSEFDKEGNGEMQHGSQCTGLSHKNCVVGPTCHNQKEKRTKISEQEGSEKKDSEDEIPLSGWIKLKSEPKKNQNPRLKRNTLEENIELNRDAGIKLVSRLQGSQECQLGSVSKDIVTCNNPRPIERNQESPRGGEDDDNYNSGLGQNSRSNPNDPSIEPEPNSHNNPIQKTLTANEPSILFLPNPNSSWLRNASWFSLSEDSPIKMTDSLRQTLERLEVVKRTPQRPHFRNLERLPCQEMRQRMAIGLITQYVNLTKSMKNISVDDLESLKSNIGWLDTLEEHGFNIDLMRTILEGVIEIKSNSKLVDLKEELSKRKRDCDKNRIMLDEIGTKLSGLKRQVDELTRERSADEDEANRMLNLIAENQDEISRMKKQIMNINSARERFDRVLAAFVRS